ncbi:hypothetical protein C8R43DRAFT_818845, partial [Mycena crocata]
PIPFSPHLNLFDASVDCGPVSGKLSVDMAVTGTVQPEFSILAAGSVFPPEITEIKVVTGVNADVTGTLTLSAELTGHVDSGKIPLFTAGIAGLGFPGILEIGPTFDLNAQFVGDVDLTMDLAVGLNYIVNDAQFTFPPDDSATNSNAFTVGDTPLKLSASPSVKAMGMLTAHLIPTLNFGLKALGGTVDATLFVALDASAALVLSQLASTPLRRSRSRSRDEVSTSFGGCVDVNGGIDVDAGITGDFFGLFDGSKSVNLFSKKFKILEKCFGDISRTTRPETRRSMRRVYRRNPFSCPAPGLSPLAVIADETVSASK